MWCCTCCVERSFGRFIVGLAVALAAFLLLAGLGADSLPFPRGAAFSDAVTTHWPSALFLRRSVLEDHSWPLWRPLLMSGQPFAANPLNKVWYPPQWLVFVLPPTLHLNVLTWAHLALAGAGAYAWGRVSGLLPLAAALAGATYAFAPRLIAGWGAGHLDLLYAAAWVPWLLWAAERTISARRSRAWLWLGVVSTLCLLADIRLSLYALVLTGAYASWRLAALRGSKARVDAAWRLALAGLLGASLAAFQWVPLLLYRGLLTRTELSLDDAAVNSIAPGTWFGLLIGDHGGHWETLVYVGVSTLALAAAATLIRPRQFAFWAVALLVISLYAMGEHTPFWTIVNQLIPPLRWWRVPSRVWLLAALILPYLAAWGAQLLATEPSTRRNARLAAAAAVSGGLACAIFSSVALHEQVGLAPALGVLALPTAALIALLALTRRLPPQALIALLGVVVLADVLWIDRTLIEGRPERAWLTPYRPLADYLRDTGAARVYSPTYSLPQQAAAFWDIPQFGGIDPFQMTAYVTAANAATGVTSTGYSVTLPPFSVDEATHEGSLNETERLARANRGAPLDPERLGQWLVTHVVAAYPLDAPGLELEAEVGGVLVYRNLYAPDVRLYWDTPNRVQVLAREAVPAPLHAVAAGRWSRASQAPGLPGESAAPGETWTFHYDSAEVWLSAAAAGAGLALCCLVSRGRLRG